MSSSFISPFLGTSYQQRFRFPGGSVCRSYSSAQWGRSTAHCCAATTSSMALLKLEIKTVAGEERGLFGLQMEEREALETIIRAVERENPTKEPTANFAEAAAGSWRLLYTNLEILGRKRVRLAIGNSERSGFVKLGDFIQVIDPVDRESKSIVEFKMVTGGGGTFTISADYEVVSPIRVDVTTKSTLLEPEKLEKLLGENRALLTKIFNPQGWLDITYVDESIRIGRDNKGHVFVLEKL